MRLVLVLFVLISVVEARVTFATSEVLDNVDLKGTNTAVFRCMEGCRVYSPTKNDKIVIVDIAGNEYKTLMDLSTLKIGESYELPKENGPYHLKNKGVPNPSFFLYAVEKGAPNYFVNVAYVDATSSVTLSAKNDAMYTVLSSSGAVRFSEFKGDFSGALPGVYAVGFDVATPSCRRVYTAKSPSLALSTAFPVYSPIATITFERTGDDKSVVVSGDFTTATTKSKDSSAVYVSPGYVGCETLDDTLYTNLPKITGIESYTQISDSDGLDVTVNGEYSIGNQADALTLTINDQIQKLYGTSTISKKYDATSFKIQLSWTYNENNNDRFALQIDTTTMGAEESKTTKKGDSGAPTTARSPDVTTSSVNPLTLLTSCLIVPLFLAI